MLDTQEYFRLALIAIVEALFILLGYLEDYLRNLFYLLISIMKISSII